MESQQTKQPFLETYAVPILIAFVAIGALLLQARPSAGIQVVSLNDAEYDALAQTVTPSDGVELPVVWADLGKQLVESGAIDRMKLISLYNNLSEEEALLDGRNDKRMRITRENAPYLLNLLWAFGLANKNPILEDQTEMMNPVRNHARASAPEGPSGRAISNGVNPGVGDPSVFASVGGWTLARGDAMEHYGAHSLVMLTDEQQALVEKISRGIYRPCCDNSTHFPDCNHGMAMLGLLELMASQGVSEEEMYKAALAVNSYWFPGTYQMLAEYMKTTGVEWRDVSPKEMLSESYSSASGFARVSELIQNSSQGGQGSGAGCGV